jgi:transcriptional regulator with XRE-family HTH domain
MPATEPANPREYAKIFDKRIWFDAFGMTALPCVLWYEIHDMPTNDRCFGSEFPSSRTVSEAAYSADHGCQDSITYIFRIYYDSPHISVFVDVQKLSTNRLDIGRSIRRNRLETGWTQRQLSERLDVTQQMVQKYEKGTASITLDRLKEIAGALGCEVSMLLESPDPPPDRRLPERTRPLTGQEKELLAEFAKIKELSRRRLVLHVLRVFAMASPES